MDQTKLGLRGGAGRTLRQAAHEFAPGRLNTPQVGQRASIRLFLLTAEITKSIYDMLTQPIQAVRYYRAQRPASNP